MEIKVPSLGGDLFVTFDTLELMSFLGDCGKCCKNDFPLKVYYISSDFAGSFFNIKYFTTKIEKNFTFSNNFFDNHYQKKYLKT